MVFFQRRFCAIQSVILAGLLFVPTLAAAGSHNEPTLLEQPTITVQLHQPARLLQNEMLGKIADVVRSSAAWKQGWSRPEASPLLEFYRTVEQAVADPGENYADVWRRIASGQVHIEARENQGVVALIQLPSEKLLVDLLTGVGTEAGIPAAMLKKALDGNVHPVGEAFLCRQGNRLLLSDREATLKKARDRSRDFKLAGTNDSPLLHVQVDLAQVRQNPDVKKALKQPADDAGVIVLLGGWLDLVRQADELHVTLRQGDSSLDIDVQVNAGRNAISDELKAYFGGLGTGSKTDFNATPLQLPDTIFATTFARDWAKLWEQRAELVTQSAVDKLDKGQEELRKQLSVFGINFLAGDLVKSLGATHHLAIAAAEENPYDVELPEQLPAGVFAVSLRDADGFRKQVDPLFRAISLIAAFGEAKMARKSARHEGEQLSSLAFRDDAKSVAAADRQRYNFMPTWVTTKSHFIIGSRPQIVRQTIDWFKANPAAEETQSSLSEQCVERAGGSWTAVAAAVMKFQPAIRRTLALEQGLPLHEADAELARVQSILKSLESWRSETVIAAEETHIRIHLGKP